MAAITGGDLQVAGPGVYPGLPLAENAVTAASADNPSLVSGAVLGMREYWTPIQICIGGTKTLRSFAGWIVPPEPKEDEDAYNRRIYHATLAPFLLRLANQAAGTILRKGIRIEGDPYWEDWARDVTGDQTTLNELCRNWLVSALLYGHSSMLVDFTSDAPAGNLADQRARRDRPYLVHVEAPQILGWRTVGGVISGQLEQVRISERIVKPVGRFGESTYEQVRVIERGSYDVYQRPVGGADASGGLSSAGWQRTSGGEITVDKVPLVTCYSMRKGTLLSTPPLMEVAYLNISYAQRFADYHHSIHVGASPILALLGFDDESLREVGLSVNKVLLLPPGGDGKYIAPPSDCYAAQLECLQTLEDQISRLGINTLASQNLTNAAAASKRMDRIDSDSIMAGLSKDLERSLEDVFELAAAYAGVEPPTVSVPHDFEHRLLDGNQLTAMLQLYMQGAISQRTLLEVLTLGEVLPATLDIEDEIEVTKAMVEEQQANDMAMEREKATIQADAMDAMGGAENAGQGRNPNSQTLPTPIRPGRNPD